MRITTRPSTCRGIAGAALALSVLISSAAPSLAQPAVPADETVQPTADQPTLFERVFDRQDYLRQSRDLRRRAESAEREAERARESATEARRAAEPPPLPPRPLAPLPPVRLENEREERLRAERAAENARQRQLQARLERHLEAGRRADRASLEAESAEARAARTRQIVRGLDRLYGGAAARWDRVGEGETLSPGPLIRTPEVVTGR